MSALESLLPRGFQRSRRRRGHVPSYTRRQKYRPSGPARGGSRSTMVAPVADRVTRQVVGRQVRCLGCARPPFEVFTLPPQQPAGLGSQYPDRPSTRRRDDAEKIGRCRSACGWPTACIGATSALGRPARGILRRQMAPPRIAPTQAPGWSGGGGLVRDCRVESVAQIMLGQGSGEIADRLLLPAVRMAMKLRSARASGVAAG